MKRYSRGFNLLELMTAVAIVAILLGWGVPTFRQMSRNNTVTVAQNDLVTALNLARSEALRRNRPVSVCSSTDGADCAEDDTVWNMGWIAFVDRGNPGVVDGDDQLIQVWETANTNLIFDAGGAAFVQYEPTGMTTGGMTMEVYYTGCSGPRLRRVTVLATGAITGQTDQCP